MAYEMVMPYHLHMPSYFLGTFTEYPLLLWLGQNGFYLKCIVSVYTGHECDMLHICENDLFLFFQCCENQTFQFFRQFGVVLNHLFGGVTSLSQFGFVVAVP